MLLATLDSFFKSITSELRVESTERLGRRRAGEGPKSAAALPPPRPFCLFTLARDDGRIALRAGPSRAARMAQDVTPSGTDDCARRHLLDCKPDELSHIAQHLLDDLTAGACSLARLACSCKCWHALVLGLQPQLAQRAAALGCPALTALSLEQLAVLEAVAALCAYPSELRQGPVGTVYFTKGDARLRPGSSLDRLEQFAALMRRHPRATCRVDAHAVGSRAQRIFVAARRADAVMDALVTRGVPPEALEAFSWEDRLTGAAGWAPGGYETRRAEVSFVLDGVTLPPRPAYYAGVAAQAAEPILLKALRKPTTEEGESLLPNYSGGVASDLGSCF